MRFGTTAPSQASDGLLPTPSFGQLYNAAIAALAVLWLPLALLQEVDALRVFTPWPNLLRDFALMWPMAAVVAAGLAGVAWASAALVRASGRGAAAQTRIAWALLLLPLGWLLAWQLTRSARLWLQSTGGITLSVGSHTRIVGILALALLMLWLWRRFGAHRLGHRAIDALLALRVPSLVLVVAGSAAAIAWPPEVRSSPASAPPPFASTAPDVLLITLDALAAEDAAVCGSGPTLMPRLRELTARATCFDRFYASANFTTPTTSTIETGALPWTHLATQIAAKLPPPLRGETLAARLRAVGYRTHVVTDNFLASPLHHGTWRAFDDQRFARSLLRNRLREMLTMLPDTTLPLVVDAILSFVGALDFYLHGQHNPYDSARAYAPVSGMLAKAGSTPAFVWVHTMPPHAPYLPPADVRHRLLPAGELERWHQLLPENMPYEAKSQPLVDKHRLRYRESIMGADAALGRALDELDRAGRLDRALVIVSSDHGESFERRFIGHAGPLLHEAVIRVPLVVKLPGQASGRVIDQPVSQADLAPTILDLAGAQPLEHSQGRSLRALLQGASLQPVPVFAMSMERQSRFEPIRVGHYAVIDGRYKLLWHLAEDRVELYDLQTDARERDDLSRRRPDLVARLKPLLRERLARAELDRARLMSLR